MNIDLNLFATLSSYRKVNLFLASNFFLQLNVESMLGLNPLNTLNNLFLIRSEINLNQFLVLTIRSIKLLIKYILTDACLQPDFSEGHLLCNFIF